mmetsp:Transcript_2240/g.5196  ORF Transcript_2240/g.5196 Transcript_2240/m.5196 type:complete len:508 (-) Transcript_2240:1075-2598(-)
MTLCSSSTSLLLAANFSLVETFSLSASSHLDRISCHACSSSRCLSSAIFTFRSLASSLADRVAIFSSCSSNLDVTSSSLLSLLPISSLADRRHQRKQKTSRRSLSLRLQCCRHNLDLFSSTLASRTISSHNDTCCRRIPAFLLTCKLTTVLFNHLARHLLPRQVARNFLSISRRKRSSCLVWNFSTASITTLLFSRSSALISIFLKHTCTSCLIFFLLANSFTCLTNLLLNDQPDHRTSMTSRVGCIFSAASSLLTSSLLLSSPFLLLASSVLVISTTCSSIFSCFLPICTRSPFILTRSRQNISMSCFAALSSSSMGCSRFVSFCSSMNLPHSFSCIPFHLLSEADSDSILSSIASTFCSTLRFSSLRTSMNFICTRFIASNDSISPLFAASWPSILLHALSLSSSFALNSSRMFSCASCMLLKCSRAFLAYSSDFLASRLLLHLPNASSTYIILHSRAKFSCILLNFLLPFAQSLHIPSSSALPLPIHLSATLFKILRSLFAFCA